MSNKLKTQKQQYPTARITADEHQTNIELNECDLDDLKKIFSSESKMFVDKNLFDLSSFHINSCEESSGKEDIINSSISTIADLKPKDPIEVYLVKHLIYLHSIINVKTNQIAKSNNISPGDITAIHKFITLFNNTVTTFSKYKRGAKQTITVEHLNVSDGSQAVIGSIEQRK